MLTNLRLNNPFRGYILPTDSNTNKTVPIYAKRIINIQPATENPNHTFIDCGACVGFETYTVTEPIQAVKNMIRDTHRKDPKHAGKNHISN